MIELFTSIMSNFNAVWTTVGMLHQKGISFPAALSPASLKPEFDEGKFFLCVVSGWDIMLGEQPDSKRQRASDLEAFFKTVIQNCEGIFPSSIMKLLEAWATCRDIRLVL